MTEIHQRDIGDGRWFEARDPQQRLEGLAVVSLQEKGLNLDTIHVVPIARRKGIATILLEAIFKWGKENGAEEITGDFSPEYIGGQDEFNARLFYKKHGIEITADNKLKGKVK